MDGAHMQQGVGAAEWGSFFEPQGVGPRRWPPFAIPLASLWPLKLPSSAGWVALRGWSCNGHAAAGRTLRDWRGWQAPGGETAGSGTGCKGQGCVVATRVGAGHPGPDRPPTALAAQGAQESPTC